MHFLIFAGLSEYLLQSDAKSVLYKPKFNHYKNYQESHKDQKIVFKNTLSR